MILFRGPVKTMTIPRIYRAAGAAALLFTGGGVHADILSFNPALAHLVVKPENQRYTPNAYNKPLTNIWNERLGVTLPVNLPVDFTNEGTYNTVVQLGNASIPAGTRIDSHYLYFDPANSSGEDLTVTFTGRILGVIIESDRMGIDKLLQSDALARPDVPRKNFPRGHFRNRGLEMPLAPNVTLAGRVGHDWVHMEGNTITIHVHASNPGDQIRVITASAH